MTPIDHQQAAIDAAMPVMRRRDRCPNDSDCLACKAGVGQILAAAAPHLRAAWEQPIRGICEQAIQDKEDSLCRMFNGEPFPAMIPATAVLDLLEGGGE